MSALPTRPASDTFYDIVDVSSPKSRAAWQSGAARLLALAERAPLENVRYFRGWAADTFTGLGEIDRALEVFPPPELGRRASMQTDRLLTLKIARGRPASGMDVATLFGPMLTSYGRSNIDEIAMFLESRVSALYSNEGRDVLREWAVDARSTQNGTSLFSGHASYVWTPYPPGYHFSLSPTAQASCRTLMRDAENTLREERDVPRIGEGWIAETVLYYSVRAAFPGEIVIQHGRPQWLGRQHLDIYLPGRHVALEYQGAQHDRAVAFFGGELAYQKTVERDRTKLAKCRRHGVRLLYVREGYDLPSVLDAIAEASR